MVVVVSGIGGRRTGCARVAVWCGVVRCGWLGGPGGDLLSRVLRRSTIGAEGFHGRVRDGIGCLPPRHDHRALQANLSCRWRAFACVCVFGNGESVFAAGALGALHEGRLRTREKERRGIKPIERLVPVSFTHCCASTPGLSTWWSSTALGETWF